MISWNGRDPKYDLRNWAPEHEKMEKGIIGKSFGGYNH